MAGLRGLLVDGSTGGHREVPVPRVALLAGGTPAQLAVEVGGRINGRVGAAGGRLEDGPWLGEGE